MKERTIKEQNSRKQEMMVDTAFKYLKIVVDRKVGSWKRILQVRSAEEETISMELMVKTSNFNSEIGRPSCQSSTVLKFVKLRYQ